MHPGLPVRHLGDKARLPSERPIGHDQSAWQLTGVLLGPKFKLDSGWLCERQVQARDIADRHGTDHRSRYDFMQERFVRRVCQEIGKRKIHAYSAGSLSQYLLDGA